MRRVRLPARVSDTLNWKAELQDVSPQTLWELDLGLLDGLTKPIDDEPQLKTLQLAIDHFNEAVFSKFAAQTAGLILYTGPIETGERAELLASYLDLLIARLHEDVPAYIDYQETDLRKVALAVANPAFNHVRYLINSTPYKQASKVAILLPDEGATDALAGLLPGEDVRFISESRLVTEWDGVDYLLVDPAMVTHRCRRSLNGFCAAGGVVVSLAEEIGLGEEISFAAYQDLLLSC